jgi:outer membrane protein TolC
LLDAVNAAISRHPALEIQRQEVEVNAALERQASSAFDQVIGTGFGQDRVYSPQLGANAFALGPTNSSRIGASYSRRLRSGVAISGSMNLQRQIDTAGLEEGLSTSTTRLQVVVPLMRGRGSAVTTSAERAAGLQRESAVLDVRHTTATLMARAVESYWALVAADRSRAVAADSARRGAALVENTRALVAADQSPRTDLTSAAANASDREANRFVAEQAYVEARQQLWLDIGYRPEDRPEVTAIDDFSLLENLPNIDDLPEDAEPFMAGALVRRADYFAAQSRIDAARVLRDGAADELKPQVDFSVNVGYTALAEGRAFSRYWSAAAAGVEGPDILSGITYRFPVENRLASGRLAVVDAQLRQEIVSRDDLVRSIRSSIVTSYSAVRNALLRLQRARESAEAFQEALRGEQDKLALGVGSVINLLTVEDRLTAAAEREVAALQGYGRALIEFRFAIGGLVPVRDELPPLDVRTFTTFPFELAAARR